MASHIDGLAELERRWQLTLARWRDIARKQRENINPGTYRALGASPEGTIALTFPSKGKFYDFVQMTGAGSRAIEGPKPLVLLDIDNEEAIYEAFYGYGARFSFVRGGDKIEPDFSRP